MKGTNLAADFKRDVKARVGRRSSWIVGPTDKSDSAAQREIGEGSRVQVVPEPSADREAGRVVRVRVPIVVKSEETVDMEAATRAAPGEQCAAGAIEHGHCANPDTATVP
jgi:hypothetical protein